MAIVHAFFQLMVKHLARQEVQINFLLSIFFHSFLPSEQPKWIDFKSTRPKPAYARQGLDRIVGPGYSFVVFSISRFAPPALSSIDDPKTLASPTGGSKWPPMVQNRGITNRGIQLASFGAKTWRHQKGDQTDLLWCKNMTSPTRWSNWPFRCLD